MAEHATPVLDAPKAVDLCDVLYEEAYAHMCNRALNMLQRQDCRTSTLNLRLNAKDTTTDPIMKIPPKVGVPAFLR